jgi:uncharacterized protein YecT (DUF1311 family)
MMKLYVLVLFVLFPAVVSGQQCEQAHTTTELRDCLDREVRLLDDQVRELEASEAESLQARQQTLFQRASRAWRLYRDLECDFEAAGFEGGSMAPIAELQCRLRLAQRRREDLQQQLKGEG